MEKRDNSIIDFSDITDKDLYINDKNNQDIDEIMDLNVSWASLVEEELGDSLNDKKLSGSITSSTIIPELDIETILGSKVDSLDDLVILEYQTFVSGHLRRHVRYLIETFNKNPDNFDKTDFIRKLEWLRMTSKFLSDKLKLSAYQNENKTTKIFQRSSYKFCSYNYECEFNYNVKKYKGCFAQHYVHNIVYADITTLIKCIIKLDKINIELIRELKKSMSTISFVINHMYEELKNVLLVSKKSFGHINRKTSRKRNNNNKRRKK